MFRTSICPSSAVHVVCCCIWCSALGIVAVVLRSRCVVLCTVHKTLLHGTSKLVSWLIAWLVHDWLDFCLVVLAVCRSVNPSVYLQIYR
jgi:hypothetical protein